MPINKWGPINRWFEEVIDIVIDKRNNIDVEVKSRNTNIKDSLRNIDIKNKSRAL